MRHGKRGLSHHVLATDGPQTKTKIRVPPKARRLRQKNGTGQLEGAGVLNFGHLHLAKGELCAEPVEVFTSHEWGLLSFPSSWNAFGHISGNSKRRDAIVRRTEKA